MGWIITAPLGFMGFCTQVGPLCNWVLLADKMHETPRIPRRKVFPSSNNVQVPHRGELKTPNFRWQFSESVK